MEFKKLPNQRLGQTMFSFLEWVAREKKIDTKNSYVLADPFYIEDKKLKEYYEEFYETHKGNN